MFFFLSLKRGKGDTPRSYNVQTSFNSFDVGLCFEFRTSPLIMVQKDFWENSELLKKEHFSSSKTYKVRDCFIENLSNKAVAELARLSSSLDWTIL